MAEKGYSKLAQPLGKDAPVMIIGTIANGGNPDDFLEGEALITREAENNAQSQGDNPSLSDVVNSFFGKGPDTRNRS